MHIRIRLNPSKKTVDIGFLKIGSITVTVSESVPPLTERVDNFGVLDAFLWGPGSTILEL